MITTTGRPGTAHLGVRAEARGAFLALLGALAKLDRQGRTTPCQLAPDEWWSDSADDRARAAAACGLCPVRRLCANYATAQRERAGVFGGRDRTPRVGRPKIADPMARALRTTSGPTSHLTDRKSVV